MGLLIYLLPIGRRYKVIFSLLYSLAMILVAGFREDSVGTDTIRYAYAFYDEITEFSLESKSSIELLWGFLKKTIEILGFPTYYILLASSFFTIFFVYYACLKNSVNLSLSLLIFYCLFYFISLNGVRQMLAASIILIGYTFLLKGNTLKFIITTLLATGVHTSSCFVLIALFFCKLKFLTKEIVILIPIICYILGCLGIERFFEFIYSYFGSYQQYSAADSYYVNWSIGGILYNLLTMSIYIFLLLSDKEDNWKMKQLYFLYVCFSLLFLNSIIFQRLALTLGFIQILYYPYVINEQKNKKKRILLACVLFLISYTCFNSLLRGFNEIIPYKARLNF